MAGLATHLHFHEPSNFVLVSFLQGGLFHEICQPGENGKGAKCWFSTATADLYTVKNVHLLSIKIVIILVILVLFQRDPEIGTEIIAKAQFLPSCCCLSPGGQLNTQR